MAASRRNVVFKPVWYQWERRSWQNAIISECVGRDGELARSKEGWVLYINRKKY